MSSPEFIAWLEREMSAHGRTKVVPGQTRLRVSAESFASDLIERAETARILKEARLEELLHQRVRELLGRRKRPKFWVAKLRERVIAHLRANPSHQWKQPVENAVRSAIAAMWPELDLED